MEPNMWNYFIYKDLWLIGGLFCEHFHNFFSIVINKNVTVVEMNKLEFEGWGENWGGGYLLKRSTLQILLCFAC